jgi:hypothetical protein
LDKISKNINAKFEHKNKTEVDQLCVSELKELLKLKKIRATGKKSKLQEL